MTMEKKQESNTVGFTSLYELNKQGFQYVPAISKEKTTEKLKEIGKWFKDKKYCMLLCRERYDYTVFNFIKKGYTQAALNDLRECINNRGKCLDIIYEDDKDAYEIWIRIDKEVFMFLLFDCEDFIIEA